MLARLPLLGIVLGALVLAGCAQPEPLTGPAAVEVSVLDNLFQPADIQAGAGQDIVFTNNGQTDHTVTIAPAGSDAPQFDQPIAPGQTVTVSGLAAGNHRLRCTIHSADFTTGQVGTITVA